MAKKTILIDQDGPLADFEGYFLEKWKERYPDEFYLPLEKRRGFYISLDYPAELKEKVLALQWEKNFILNLPPVSGGVEAVKEMVQEGHDVWICTSPLSAYENCVPEKFSWVEKYFGREFTKKIILTKDKTLIKGDYLIDDKPEITGSMKPNWEHIIFDAPYNKESPGKRLIGWSDWRKVLFD